jgi:hypothetical protein
MITPQLKTLVSADLDRPNVPDEPGNCEVALEATIGPDSSDASEVFAFSVVTPAALGRETRFRWGRGLLIVPTFSWEIVDHALARLLAHCSRATWPEVARQLNQNLYWEFDNYRERERA